MKYYPNTHNALRCGCVCVCVCVRSFIEFHSNEASRITSRLICTATTSVWNIMHRDERKDMLKMEKRGGGSGEVGLETVFKCVKFNWWIVWCVVIQWVIAYEKAIKKEIQCGCGCRITCCKTIRCRMHWRAISTAYCCSRKFKFRIFSVDHRMRFDGVINMCVEHTAYRFVRGTFGFVFQFKSIQKIGYFVYDWME